MAMLNVSAHAPDFTLNADDGTLFKLSDSLGQPIVLFFYPKANTPGCTLEAQDFTQLLPNFEAISTKVIGISADPVAAQCAFKAKQKLSVPLLSDPDLTVLSAYGVWGEKQNYGKTYMGIIRTTYLLNPKGEIVAHWKVARTKGHAAKVLDMAQQLFGKSAQT